MAATAMMATLMVAVVVLIRSSYAVWQAHESDMQVAESAYAALRHIVRNARQASGVSAISASSDTTGNLSLTMDSGEIWHWQHDGSGQVLFGIDPASPTEPLAFNIDQLTFVGYEADGTTPTTVVEDIHSIKCAVQITLPAAGGTVRTVSCYAWIRTW
ncbi:hypothetical protein Pan181_33390 [Aeoliella mucimassa]|uniref:General secretion pathway GspH domain-containing protein n=2 Tax=Aeoliella mucimassa TaxID=2527972 RepID=A0A518AQY4_9BACT|nr:hypothetical protein Pan181_33390 [Aeoliella mucimassa]